MKRDPREYLEHAEVAIRAIEEWTSVIVHDYLGLNFERIWQIATTNVPALRPHIQRIAAERSVE